MSIDIDVLSADSPAYWPPVISTHKPHVRISATKAGFDPTAAL
jgi:hypothetical protein